METLVRVWKGTRRLLITIPREIQETKSYEEGDIIKITFGEIQKRGVFRSSKKEEEYKKKNKKEKNKKEEKEELPTI